MKVNINVELDTKSDVDILTWLSDKNEEGKEIIKVLKEYIKNTNMKNTLEEFKKIDINALFEQYK